MFKAASNSHHNRTTAPMSQRGRKEPHFGVCSYLRKNDNQGNSRLFRYIEYFWTRHEALKLQNKREKTGKYEYSVAFEMDTLDVVKEFGNPDSEDEWLDSETQPHPVHPEKTLPK